MAEQIMQNAAGKTIPAGYKQTEVGVIPEDWDLTPLGNLIEKIEYGSSSKSHVKGLVPVLRMGNLQDGKINWDDLVFTSNSFEIDKYCLNKGDVLFNRTNSIDLVGKTSIYDGWRKAIFAGYLIRIKTNQLVLDSNYLNFILNTPFARAYGLKVVSVGVSQANINGQKLKTYPIPHPKQVEEQTAIANVLSDSDALIDALEQLIAKKQAIKSATMQQLLTGRTRLPAFALRPDGTPKGYKPSELGDIPQDWEVVSLGNLLAYEQPTKYLVSHSKFLDEGSHPVLTAGKSLVLGYTNEENGVFTDLPVIIFDDFTTDSKFVDFPFKAKSSAMKMLKPRNQKIPLSLIYNLLNSVDYLVGDHKRHWIGEFQFLNVVMPSDNEEQTAIATILSDMDNELQALTQKLEKARALKQGMMQQLLTGKIRLIKPSKEVIHE